MSPDLKLATVAIMPLGGKDAQKTLAALDAHKKALRTLVAHRVNLKYAPDLRFVLDSSFDAQPKIDALLRSPEVARDLGAGRRRGRQLNEEAEDETVAAEGRRARPARGPKREPRRSTRVEVNGWVNLDKPVGVTSTQAVAQLKFLFNAKKAGHAGTLDPLASGVLPIAFGEATKTVSVVQDGVKAYRFTVSWGEETDTDDAEGRVDRASRMLRPSPGEDRGGYCRTSSARSARRRRPIPRSRSPASAPMILRATAPQFEIASREIVVHRLDLVSSIATRRCSKPNAAKAPMSARSRAIWARAGLPRPCRAAATHPRRAFSRRDRGVELEALRDSAEARAAALLSIEAGLSELARVPIDRSGAATLRRGQKLLLRGSAAPAEGPAYAICLGRRSRSAWSKAAISFRPGCSICRTERALLPGRRWRPLTIFSPSLAFSNVSLAIRSSASSIGKSNQPCRPYRVDVARDIGVGAVEADQEIAVVDLDVHAGQRRRRRADPRDASAARRCP